MVPFAELVLGALTTARAVDPVGSDAGRLPLITALQYLARRCGATGTPVGFQMIYAITYYFLLVHRSSNRFSLDALLGR